MATAARIAGTDEDFRGTVVGASEVPALFDASQWLTRFELWHRKNGTIATPDFGGNDRIEAGIFLEPGIVNWACHKWGYTKLDTPDRLENGNGLGGHPDQMVMCPRRGRGILEVKTVDWLVFKGWGDEPPLSYQLQLQSYIGLAGVSWGDLIVVVGGNDPRRFEYPAMPVIYADIERRVADFWQSVADGKPPKPDYSRDGDTIADVIGAPTDEPIDLRRDNRASILACAFLDAKARAKAAEADADAAKAELIEKIGDAGSAMIEGYSVGCGMTKGTADKVITAEMVGEIIKGRRGYRRFDVKEKVA